MAGPAARALERSMIGSGGRTLEEGVQGVRNFDPEQFLGANALQSMFDVSTVSNFMPQLRAMQARASSMGHRGPIAGALEGDLASAFQRNLMGTVAQFGSQRAGLTMDRARTLGEFGGQERAQGLEMMAARHEREEARRRSRRGTVGSLLGAFAGGAIGSFVPGLGTAVGASIGSRVGGGLGGG
jgi:hypothetical protein